MTDDNLFDRVLNYQQAFTAFFAGGDKFEDAEYQSIRRDLLDNQAYGGLAPSWLRRNRDVGALWSYAKSVDSSWEPRRQFVRSEFEPLLDHLERGGTANFGLPGPYDSSAWTGVQTTAQRAHAIKTLVPVAQAAIGKLIEHLEAPNHNGSPPLDEVAAAIQHLRSLYVGLGKLLLAVEEGNIDEAFSDGLVAEVARYGRQAAKTLRHDPLPYALTAACLAVFTACGIPGIGGYLGTVAMTIKKPRPEL